ncbi:MAG: carbohydrate ABC transporter permease [Anaerolineae bacterium]|nr:carbohydrate ABC transporter permease [Anaerolineae bacterium]
MYRLTWWQQVRYQAGLTLIGLFVLIPLWGIVYLAFDGGVKGWPTTFRVWPEQFTMDVFVRMWEKPAQGMPFLALLRNSLIVSAGAALLSVALGASMAYAFARYRFPGRRLGLFGLLLGVLLPPVALMVPLYLLLSALGIRTTLFGLTLVYTSFAMPFCIWNMRAAFQAVALELEESAFLDGASPWVTFWRITLPLALPAIAVAGLIAFLIGYSEFAMGWLFVDKAQNVTLAMAISGMVQSSYLDSWANLAALALMMSLPVVVIFLAAQRYLINRLLLGPVES